MLISLNTWEQSNSIYSTSFFSMSDQLDLIKQKTLRLMFLYEEIELINAKIEPQDCGHLKTAVGVLREQLKELREEIYAVKSQNE